MGKYELSSLNELQKQLVLKTEGAILVAAGAGSGKTRLLTHRIAHIVDNLRVAPYQVLAITFTNKAAEEMRNRLAEMVDDSNDLWVMTFHSLCVRILRRDADVIGYNKNFSIYSDSDSERVVKRILSKLATRTAKESENFYKTVLNHISMAKSNGLTPMEYAQHLNDIRDREDIIWAYEEYEKELKRSNALDFDDLLMKALMLLTQSKEVREHYQNKFRYIHIDEFQDTSKSQYEIVKILANKHKNIFAVGDEDQSIYGWRGASIKNISNFISDLNAEVFKLEQNYRSSKSIIECANKVICKNKNRIDKVLWTENNKGARVEFRREASEGAEADFVVATINSLIQYSGYNYNDFSILMRINALSRTFEERLMYYNIPYKVFGGFKFYERKEIKDVLAYLKVLANPDDRESLLRIINFPKRGIGEASIQQLINYCDIENKPLIKTILSIAQNTDLPRALVKKMTVFSQVLADFFAAADQYNILKLAQYIIKALELEKIYGEEGIEGENRIFNLQYFIAGIEEFVSKNKDATLSDYLSAVSLYSDLDDFNEQNRAVNLSTIHAAKGLEFKVVFVVGLEEGIFPLRRATDSLDELEEERRLMYVALTRARDRLYLTRADSRFLYGKRNLSVQSRFIKEAESGDTTSSATNLQNQNYGQFSKNRVGSDQSYGGSPMHKYGQNNDNSISGDAFESDNSIKYDAKGSAKEYLSQIAPLSAQLEQKACSFEIGQRVRHRRFGDGTVLAITGEGLTECAEIDFDKGGKLSLMTNYAPLEKL